MAFSVSANPTSFTLQPGGSQDVTFTFTGVPGEATGSAIVLFQLGAESVTVALDVALDEPDPVVGTITTPTGVTATILGPVTDEQAVIRFAR
jgi:hypothetical protein